MNTRKILYMLLSGPLACTTSHASPTASQPTLSQQQDNVRPVARHKRGAFLAAANRWPDNTVYYALSNANKETRTAFLAAARAISSQSTVHFVERRTEPNYLLVATSNSFDSCGTMLGMIRGPQPLTLNPVQCYAPGEEVGIVLHEIMHTLGIEHEHQRNDRNTYGQMVYPDHTDQTEINQKISLSGSFDIDSVMMYDKNIFKPHPGVQSRPWPRNSLSAGDIATLQLRYPPSAAPKQPTLTDNGVEVTTRKRSLTLLAKSSEELTLQFPPGIQINHPKIQWMAYDLNGKRLKRSEIPLAIDTFTVVANAHGTEVTLLLRALASRQPLSVMMVLDSNATDRHGVAIGVSAMVVVNVVPEGQQANVTRQLVSGYRQANGTAQCLESSRLESHRPAHAVHTQFFGHSSDNLQLMMAALAQDRALAVKLAPCDAEHLGQLWRYDEKSGLLLDSTENFYLDSRSPLATAPRPVQAFALHARRLPPASKDVVPLAPVWLRQGQRFIYRAHPGFSLSQMQGQTAWLAATQKKATEADWQQWRWY